MIWIFACNPSDAKSKAKPQRNGEDRLKELSHSEIIILISFGTGAAVRFEIRLNRLVRGVNFVRENGLLLTEMNRPATFPMKV